MANGARVTYACRAWKVGGSTAKKGLRGVTHDALPQVQRPAIGSGVDRWASSFMGNVFYTWLYNLAQALGANLSKIGTESKPKGDPQ